MSSVCPLAKRIAGMRVTKRLCVTRDEGKNYYEIGEFISHTYRNIFLIRNLFLSGRLMFPH